MSTNDELSRRDVLRLTAGAVVASQVTALGTVVAASGHKFFTDAEYALVDELTEILIPADDHSPGARAAAVANFIDAHLAEAFDDTPRTAWRSGTGEGVRRHPRIFQAASFSSRRAGA